MEEKNRETPSKMKIKLKPNPVNKTVVIYSPLGGGNDLLVRTGTIREYSLLHALMHAYSKDYIRMDNEGRIKIVDKLYKSVKEKIYRLKWNKGEYNSKLLLQDSLNTIFGEWYRFLLEEEECTKVCKKIKTKLDFNRKEVDKREIYQTICQMISNTELDSKVITPIFKRESNNLDNLVRDVKIGIDAFVRSRFSGYIGSIGAEKVQSFIRYAKYMFDELVCQSYENSLVQYEELGIKDIFVINEDLHTIICNKFDRDIFIFERYSRRPIPLGLPKGRKALLLIYLNDEYYEPLGRLLSNEKVQREFEPKDPLIVRIFKDIQDQIDHPIEDESDTSSVYPDVITRTHRSGSKDSSGNESNASSEKPTQTRENDQHSEHSEQSQPLDNDNRSDNDEPIEDNQEDNNTQENDEQNDDNTEQQEDD
jgi:hypothetical protein